MQKESPIPDPQRIILPDTTSLSKRGKVIAWEEYQARVEAAQKAVNVSTQRVDPY